MYNMRDSSLVDQSLFSSLTSDENSLYFFHLDVTLENKTPGLLASVIATFAYIPFLTGHSGMQLTDSSPGGSIHVWGKEIEELYHLVFYGKSVIVLEKKMECIHRTVMDIEIKGHLLYNLLFRNLKNTYEI